MGRAKRHGGPEDTDPPPPPPGPPPDANLAGILANNPLLAGNQFGNPLLQANPLILATLANPAQPSAAIPQGAGNAEPEDGNSIDPDVFELCDYFHIEERHARRLNDIMKNRQETFVADMERLYDVLERANSPAGLLVVKMREMEEGTFVGKVKADKDLAAVSKKYKLDEQAESKLADILARYDDARRKEYLIEIERHLEVSNRPSAMAMLLLRKLGEGQSLGKPGPAAPGSYLDNAQRAARGEPTRSGRPRDDKGGQGDRKSPRKSPRRSREREKDRDRRRSRSRDRRSRSRRR
mmetsp:Transcript_21244/g.26202  ORF Transcript_21244/g.26202 Transcript_21244/m.26202 type:complete len:295 (+) Transcript_21244:32-916(+)